MGNRDRNRKWGLMENGKRKKGQDHGKRKGKLRVGGGGRKRAKGSRNGVV